MTEAVSSSTLGSTTGRLYQFPSTAKPGVTATPVFEALDLTQLAGSFHDLRAIVEAAVQHMTVRADVLAGVGIGNPFDAVYISKLQVDVLDATSRQQIAQHSGIEDRSDQIQFADGWDD